MHYLIEIYARSKRGLGQRDVLRRTPSLRHAQPHHLRHPFAFAISLLYLFSMFSSVLLPPATALAAPIRQDQTTPTWTAPVRPAATTSAEGETWFVTWTATGEGYYNGPYLDDDHLIRSHKISMTGSAVSRYSIDNGGTGWETNPFRWTVTDNFFQQVTSPCWSGGSSIRRENRSIIAPNTEPLWVDHFVNPGSIFTKDDGSKYMQGLWFAHSTAGMPWFPYKRDWAYQGCGSDSSSGSNLDDSARYSMIVWWQSFGRFNNQIDLDCDDTGTSCWFDHAYVSDNYFDPDMPVQVNWTVRARRLPDSPSIDQEPELLERNVFLPGVSVADRFEGNLDCDKQATCRAERQLQTPNGAQARESIGPAPTGNYPKTIDLGTLPPGRSLLIAQAEGATPAPPDTKEILVAAKLPQWAADIAGIVARKVGNYVAYVWEVKFPEPAIKKLYDVPAIVPFIGGKKAGAELPQAGLKTEAKSTGEVGIEGSTGGSLVLGDSSIGINIAGKANGILDLQGVRDVKGEAEVKVFGKVSAEEPLIKAVPALRPAVTAIDQFSPAVAKWLEDRAKAILEIEPSWSGAFGFSDKTGKIEIDNAVISPGIGIKVKAALKAYEGLLEAAVGVGGEVKAAFPTPPLELREVAVNFVVLVEGVLMHFGFGAQAGYACTFPGSCATTGQTAAAGAPVWTLSERAYLDDADYARWTAHDPAQAAASIAATTAGEVVDVQLVDNVYPQAHPALVRLSSQRVLLWSHDAPGKSATGGQDLRFTRRTGFSNDTWTAPAAVTDDSVADFNRELVTTPGNKVVAVWQRFDSATPGDMNSDPLAYLSHVQIAASFWNGTTWSAPQQLSASGSTNNRPSLAAMTGGALAVWIGNAGNQLIGDAAHPDTVYYAVFTDNPGTWGAAAPVLSNVSGLLGVQVAGRGNKVALVYSRDMDGDFGTDADREIFYVLYDNGWGSPVRLTNNQLRDESPHLVWNKDGAPQLIWQQGDALRFLDGTWNGASAQTLPFPLLGEGLRLVNDPTGSDKGHLALLWRQVTGVDTRIGYAVLDGSQKLWSAPLTLQPAATGVVTGTSTMVTHLSPALEGDRILLAYQVAQVGVSTVKVGDITVPNVPTSGKHALRYAEISLKVNARITEDDIVVTPPDAAPGATVTIHARIHNTGILPTAAAKVDLVHLVNNTKVPQDLPVIAGGDFVTVSFPYVQPSESAGPLEIRVDPNWDLNETDRKDNTARVVTAPVFDTVPTEDTPLGPIVGARFTQQGALQGEIAFTATLHLNSPTGPLVGEALAVFPEEPVAQVVTATVSLSPTQLGPGVHLIHWVGAKGALGVSAASVAADLMLYPETVAIEGNQLMVTVANQGNLTSSGGTLEVYDRDPAAPGAQLLQQFPLPAIAPGKTANVGGIVGVAAAHASNPDALPPHVFVLLKPGAGSVDLNPANNLYVLGHFVGSGPTLVPAAYLPSLAR